MSITLLRYNNYTSLNSASERASKKRTRNRPLFCGVTGWTNDRWLNGKRYIDDPVLRTHPTNQKQCQCHMCWDFTCTPLGWARRDGRCWVMGNWSWRDKRRMTRKIGCCRPSGSSVTSTSHATGESPSANASEWCDPRVYFSPFTLPEVCTPRDLWRVLRWPSASSRSRLHNYDASRTCCARNDTFHQTCST